MGERRTGLRTLARLKAAFVAACAAVSSGCLMLEIAQVREIEAVRQQYALVSGSAKAGPPVADEAGAEDPRWIVVFVVTTPCDDDFDALQEVIEARVPMDDPRARALAAKLADKIRLADHVVLQRSGFWYVRLKPGCYGVGAFVDENRNFRFDDEPAARALADPRRIFRVAPGDRVEGIDLVIDDAARTPSPFPSEVPLARTQFRSHDEQLMVSLAEVTVEGEIADLSDPRFAAGSGRLGYFEINRFLWEVGPGIYFLEPYDPDRIPVLFVHGAMGSGHEFASLIARLDRTRFQPWIASYPSGSRLGIVADQLSRSVANLQLRLGFENLAVVAHSMGGLVAREFILVHHAKLVNSPVKAFVSISTPWSGVPSATSGVKHSPFVIPSWLDMDPESEFIAGLFYEDPDSQAIRRSLPEEVAFTLIFGVEDKTVPVPSEARWEAVRDARERWPLDEDHRSILHSEETSLLLNEVLDREFP